MNNIYIQYYKSPLGELVLGSSNNKLCLCDWRYRKMRDSIDRRIMEEIKGTYIEEESTVTKNTRKQLEEYFIGERKQFELNLLLVGTQFQKSVWNELIKIPYGGHETYLGISKRIGNTNSIRAVASANGANAISIIIPCHRVIGTNGKLTGYAGGLMAKRKLLQLEADNRDKNLFSGTLF